MPHGRKLDIQDPIIMDISFMAKGFAEFNTKCEGPKCHPDLSPAFMYYQTQWSFVYLCQHCWMVASNVTGRDKRTHDLALAEHMWKLMMRRAYTHANVASGFVLEEVLAQRAIDEKKLEALASTERAAEQRELRKMIRESGTKIGAPDDELLVARQRQDIRQQMGMPRLGQQRTDRGSVLRAKLLVPNLLTTKPAERPADNEEGE